jgi:hypothetical protein
MVIILKHVKNFEATGSIPNRTECAENNRWETTTWKWCQVVDTFNKIVSYTCTANRCLHCQHELQQNCCIHKPYGMDFMQMWIFRTGTFMWCTMK